MLLRFCEGLDRALILHFKVSADKMTAPMHREAVGVADMKETSAS